MGPGNRAVLYGSIQKMDENLANQSQSFDRRNKAKMAPEKDIKDHNLVVHDI